MPALIWAAVVAIGKMLLWLLGFLIVRAIVLLGISWVTYNGIDLFINSIKERIINELGNTSEFIITTLGLIKFDVCISILFSALLLRVVVNGVNGMTKMKWQSKFYKDI